VDTDVSKADLYARQCTWDAHSTTVQDLIERGIQWIEWPAFSPDLNPIENVQNWMK